MIRNRVSWGYGLMALLLTLGMAACGGDEPAPVVQPPAPPPAPPPFQPQPVEVVLGEFGGKVTLMTTEDGGFTLLGEKFESGGVVTAENGNMYTLELADGTWSAKFDAHETMVTLGITEETVTLVKAEDGSYWIGDDAVTSGETVATASNGNMYTLSMDEDGMWMATYVEPISNVMLGASGDTAMIKKSEDGSYWLGDMTVTSGETVATAENGNMYTLSMDADGMWSASYIAPTQTVMLGEHGGNVMVKRAEDGTYWVGDQGVMNGSTVMVGDNTYVLMMGDDGMWSASYQSVMVSVTLGITGEMVSLTRAEDGSYWLGDAAVTSGETSTMAMNGNEYTLVMGDDGMWSAMYVTQMGTVAIGASGISIPAMRDEAGNWTAVHPQTGETVSLTEGGTVMATNLAGNTNTYMLSSDGSGAWTAAYQSVMVSVMLGASGSSAMLTRAEDGSYWYGDEAFMSGDEVMAENGKDYVLTMADGAWSAMFRPDSMEIKGTGGLMAYTREEDDMYDVEAAGSGIMLAASGAGDITTSAGAMYRITMMDGMLSGTRFDGAPKGDTVYITVGLDNADLLPDSEVTYIGDDRATDFNEANTKVMIAGESISLGDLLGTGMAVKPNAAADGAAGEFVNSAIDLLMDLLTEAELYAKYQADATDDAGRGAFDGRLNNIAERAQGAIDMIFGTNATDGDVVKNVNIVDDGTLPTEDPAGANAATDYIRATQTVRGLNRLLDALSSADAFVDATKDGNNGVFENALGESAARDAFSANKSEYTVYFGTTASTRYGAIALKERVSAKFTPTGGEVGVEAAAVHGLRFQFDGSPTDNNDVEVGKIGAFSYANVNDTLRSRNLPQTGGAIYMGGTIAVTPAGTLYNGDMRIDVNFRQQSVFGRVSELRDKDNNLWKYLDSEVTTIYLPRQNYNNLTQFGGMADTDNANGNPEDDLRKGTGEFKTATIVYAESQGFSTTPTEQPTNARFAGRFIGTDGAEITGTWSLGQPVGDDTTKSNDLDVIYGSYGVTRQDGEGPTGPADGTAGGAVKTEVILPGTDAIASPATLGATFEGDKDAAGILRLGKRSTGGGNDVDNDFDLKKIFASPGADPKKTVNNSPKHVQVVVDHIKAQRAIYVIYAEQVGGDSADTTDLANVGRQNAWKSINDFVKDHIFDTAAVTLSGDGTPGAVTDVENLSSPLGSYFYPMTRNGRPDDDAALDRIDALLAAFDNVFAFEDAAKDDGGGVFDNQPAIDKGVAEADRPFPLNDDPAQVNEPYADIFNRLSSQTQLFSLSTDYTRFGVWYRLETLSAVHDWENHDSPTGGDPVADTGSTSPGSYAYSWLDQSTYRTDRPVATYPSNGLATYEGKTLANTGNTQTWVGDALIRVNWSPLDTTGATPVATSTIVPIFSNFRRWDDNSLDRLVHGADGKIVDEIVFRTSAGADLVLTHDGEKLGISVADANVIVSYTDGTSAAAITGSTFMGKFVGSSGDGPLGVLGTWEVPGFRGATSTANDLVGSFGADLTSFETLLP